MPRRKKQEEFVVSDDVSEVDDDEMANSDSEDHQKPSDSHIPSLYIHHKPKKHGKRLDWRDWTKDAEQPVKMGWNSSKI